ncbi:MAG TPA: hypothetical protein VII06_23905 [Chloroflexota bacterium]
MTTLQVQNAGSEARGFPTYPLHVVNGSGTQQPDTWCGHDAPSLELQPPIAPGATAVGAGCWKVDVADAASLVLSLDPPLGQAAGQPVRLALDPIVRLEPREAAAPPAGSPAVGVDGGRATLATRGQFGLRAGEQSGQKYQYSRGDQRQSPL